jgi:hypothetical protein
VAPERDRTWWKKKRKPAGDGPPRDRHARKLRRLLNVPAAWGVIHLPPWEWLRRHGGPPGFDRFDFRGRT